ncbi:hypothetical protein [Kineococcus sp. SYSU DK003]|uniref:hypothetical protein n=1 Tax=Kineococcus sp. SYSU DK003 TaxID=3383124 RepID=UPI003D7C44F6
MGRLTVDDVACWLVKSAGWPADLTGSGPQVIRRCLRRSYRLSLMAPGQPCLLWISGPDSPGVGAVGRLADVPDADDGVLVEFHPLQHAVPRPVLVADDRFAAAEVVRMAAGSNPSYLRAGELAAVLDQFDDTTLATWREVSPASR